MSQRELVDDDFYIYVYIIVFVGWFLTNPSPTYIQWSNASFYSRETCLGANSVPWNEGYTVCIGNMTVTVIYAFS